MALGDAAALVGALAAGLVLETVVDEGRGFWAICVVVGPVACALLAFRSSVFAKRGAGRLCPVPAYLPAEHASYLRHHL